MMCSRVVLLAVCLFPCLALAQTVSYFAGYDVNNQMVLTPWDPTLEFQWMPSSAAWAQYTDYNHTTDGWSYLNVRTSANFTADQQSYAAGYLEGSLSALQIWQYWYNAQLSIDSLVQAFLDENANFMQQQIQKYPDDPYWTQAALVYRQLDGVVDGYNSAAGDLGLPQLTQQDIFLLNIIDELDDIRPAVHGQAPPVILAEGTGRCSSLIRWLPDKSELLVAHTTWAPLTQMLRIYKNYDFAIAETTNSTNIIPGHRVAFPSYPGTLFSADDFYLVSSGLIVMETTIGNADAKRQKLVNSTETVLEWMRNIIANRLATTGQEWTSLFATLNSGTYNNQFMVVDYNLFTPGQPLVPNTLWIVEQIPGMTKAADVTDVLIQQGYWASYNIAYFPEIYNASGMPAQVAAAGVNGDFFVYDKTPRALIFHALAPKVETLHDAETFMRYNKFQSDGFGKCNCSPPYSGENAIAARSDLNPQNMVYPLPSLGPRPHGALDAKIATYQLFTSSFANKAVNGPTHDDQPVFDWTTSPYNHLRHVGLPTRFDFDWTTIDWSKH